MSSADFEPERYADEYRERALAMIEKKVEGQEITVSEAPEGGAQIIDLMEALRASLEKKGGAPSKAASKAAAPARKPAKRAQAQPAAPAARKSAKK